MTNKHEFAVYVSGVLPKEKKVELNDSNIVHRIRSILRLEIGDELILFNGQSHYICRILEINKKNIALSILNTEQSAQISPPIIFLLPLLKREAFERMLYASVELGANIVQPIITQKSQGSWRSEHDLERARAIMIAAAEQSKQFAMPEIKPPLTLHDAIAQYGRQDSIRLVADPAGESLHKVLTVVKDYVQDDTKRSIVMTMGPEGDFTDAEKDMLKASSYQSVRLTSTVLRSQQAGALLLGVIRSILS